MRNSSLLIFILLCVLARTGFAAIDDYSFSSEEEEARYHKLIDEMRCPMCLNANLSGSDAPIAADLRAEILEQLEAGRSDQEIIDFMKARYGDFIMYRPPLNEGTVLLWFGPLALLAAGFFILRRMLRAARGVTADMLNPEEAERLKTLLDNDKDSTRS